MLHRSRCYLLNLARKKKKNRKKENKKKWKISMKERNRRNQCHMVLSGSTVNRAGSIFLFSDSTFSAAVSYCNDTGIVGNLCPMGKFPGVSLEISVTTSFCHYEFFFRGQSSCVSFIIIIFFRSVNLCCQDLSVAKRAGRIRNYLHVIINYVWSIEMNSEYERVLIRLLQMK